MKTCKFSVFFALLLIPFLSHAQYFDWVQTYTGSEATGSSSTNKIMQSVTDNDGNIFFIGKSAVDATLDDNIFMPIHPYGSGWNTSCTVIGKVSTQGELAWEKVIHSNNGYHHGGGSIQNIGDSLIICCMSVWVPHSFPEDWPIQTMEYLYYLDTLMYFYKGDSIVHNEHTLYNYNNYSTVLPITAYVVFDLNGNIVEQHWLMVALLNSEGEPFNAYDQVGGNLEYKNIVMVNGLGVSGTTLDNEGNIVLIRYMREYVTVSDSVLGRVEYNIDSPEVSGLRIYVDSKCYFDLPLPDTRPSTDYNNYFHNCQLLKFSPHFDSLLASQFLFEPTPEHLDSLGVFRILDLETDPDNNIFILGTYGRDLSISNDSCSFQIGGSEDVRLHFSMYDESRGFLLKYDSTLTPVYLKQIGRKDVDTPSENNRYYDGFNVMQFDDNGNIALLGATAYNDTVNTRCWFDSTELKVKGFLILRVDPDDGRLVSCKNSEISSPAMGSSAGNSTCLVAKNNRLVTQLFYRWYLNFADSLYEKPREYEWGMGFGVWDYDGNELCFVDYGTNGSASHSTSSVCLVDSVLYLTGMLASGGAQFGDVTVPNSGSSQSFIARYVDTAFMRPYVRPGSQQDIQLVVRDGEPVATVYPNPCAQRVIVDWSGDEPPLAATVIDITGRTYSVALTAAGTGQSDSGAKITGRYTIDFSSLPAANYLLTLTTPSGHRVTTRLLKR